ncbi:MAG TPA: SspB family protein [Devosia sp.]|nr:SspB family protein [Devosia sp.]
MAEDHMRYDILAQEALRGVVRKVLAEVAKTGLPGDHHFFISFVTRAPGVRLSEKLLGQYDKEMTIVIQNQYWDLKVNETAFEVGLSFDGIPETLVIPFSAVKGFFDPSVQFGLQFDPATAARDDAGQEDSADDALAEAASPAASGEGEKSGEKVVSLDAFRKKP